MARGEVRDEEAGYEVGRASMARPWEAVVVQGSGAQRLVARLARRWMLVAFSAALLAVCSLLVSSTSQDPVSLGAYSWGCDGCLPGSRYFPPSAAKKGWGHYTMYVDPAKTDAIQRIAQRIGGAALGDAKPPHVSGGHWEYVKFGSRGDEGQAKEATASEEEDEQRGREEEREADVEGERGHSQWGSEDHEDSADQVYAEGDKPEAEEPHWGTKQHDDYQAQVYSEAYKPDPHPKLHWGTKTHGDYADDVYSEAYKPDPHPQLHWGTKTHGDYVDDVYAAAYQPDPVLPYHWGTRKHEDYPEDVYGRPFVSWDIPYGVKSPVTEDPSDPEQPVQADLPESHSVSVPWEEYIKHYGVQVPASAVAGPPAAAATAASSGGHWEFVQDAAPCEAPAGATHFVKTATSSQWIHLPVWPGTHGLPPPVSKTEVHYPLQRTVQWHAYAGPCTHSWWVLGNRVGHTVETATHSGTQTGHWKWVETSEKILATPGPAGPAGPTGAAGHVNVFVMPSPAGPPGPPGPPANTAHTVYNIIKAAAPVTVPVIPAAAPAVVQTATPSTHAVISTSTRATVPVVQPAPGVVVGSGHVHQVVEGVRTVGSGGLAWGYGGSHGPSHWGALSASYGTCSGGKKQSPINVQSASVLAVPSISVPPLEWQLPVQLTANPGALLLQGGTLVMEHMSGAPIFVLTGQPYGLAGVSVHTPSEHTIDGVHADAEVQVRLSTEVKGERKNVVMAIMLHMDGTPEPSWISPLAKGVALAHGRKIVQVGGLKPNTPTALGSVDVKELMNEVVHMASWYRYDGSWTTPPCTEGVTWYVARQSRGISAPNLDLLAAVEGRNDRPTQAIDGRVVSLVIPRVPN